MVALKAEAQAFVDKYKLKNYKNENISVVITGMGKENMEISTCQVLKEMTQHDKIVNVGICGASKKYAIGELIDGCKTEICCIDYEADDGEFDIVDMESDGFFEATKGIKNRYMFKVVSDHFEPHKITKDLAKKLIFENIDEIMKRVI